MMLAITMREDCRNGERRRRVAGRKTRVDTCRRHMAVEEGVGKGARRRDVRRTQPPRRYLHKYVDDGAVGVGFASEQRGLFRVGIVAEMSDNPKGCGNKRDIPYRDEHGK